MNRFPAATQSDAQSQRSPPFLGPSEGCHFEPDERSQRLPPFLGRSLGGFRSQEVSLEEFHRSLRSKEGELEPR